MEVNEAVEILASTGLFVSHRLVRGQVWIHIARGYELTTVEDIHVVHDAGRIYHENDQWCFMKWDCCPGPGLEDIDMPIGSLASAVQILITYYFGEPTIINQWLIPLHKHPEWDVERLSVALENARNVTPEAWQKIKSESTDRFLQLHTRGLSLTQIFAYHFIPIPHIGEPDLTLHLRRDLGAAYVVHQSIAADDWMIANTPESESES
jgi:hypothetical protein